MSTDNPVRHLLWCILVALRSADPENQLSETRRRVFISRWLDGARKNPAFREMTCEFQTIRQLLDSPKEMSVVDTLNALLKQSESAQSCDLFRFRAAHNAVMQQGWRSYACRSPEEIFHQIMQRRQEQRNHVLQLTRTQAAFSGTGEMLSPATFHLVLKRRAPNQDVEKAFWSEGFEVVVAHQDWQDEKTEVRTIYVGASTLSQENWHPDKRELWQPALH